MSSDVFFDPVLFHTNIKSNDDISRGFFDPPFASSYVESMFGIFNPCTNALLKTNGMSKLTILNPHNLSNDFLSIADKKSSMICFSSVQEKLFVLNSMPIQSSYANQQEIQMIFPNSAKSHVIGSSGYFCVKCSCLSKSGTVSISKNINITQKNYGIKLFYNLFQSQKILSYVLSVVRYLQKALYAKNEVNSFY
jgi:hypothetical protein